MWLKQWMMDEKVDIEKHCRWQILWGKLIVVLGALAVLTACLAEKKALAGMDGGTGVGAEYVMSFGIAAAAGGVVKILRARRCLRNPEARRKAEVAANDERNRLLGLRCWAYSGYFLFLLLYVGILAGMFMNGTLARILLAVLGVFGLLLLGFRLLLPRYM